MKVSKLTNELLIIVNYYNICPTPFLKFREGMLNFLIKFNIYKDCRLQTELEIKKGKTVAGGKGEHGGGVCGVCMSQQECDAGVSRISV